MKSMLVIGYGNPLRRDDGAGPEVARRLIEMDLPGVEVIVAHQLLPEHAEVISHFDGVVFVDASVEEELSEVSMRKLEPRSRSVFDPHVSDPGALLAMSCQLFDGTAEAWLLRLPGVDFGIGEEFSETISAAIPVALDEVQVIKNLLFGRSA